MNLHYTDIPYVFNTNYFLFYNFTHTTIHTLFTLFTQNSQKGSNTILKDTELIKKERLQVKISLKIFLQNRDYKGGKCEWRRIRLDILFKLLKDSQGRGDRHTSIITTNEQE